MGRHHDLGRAHLERERDKPLLRAVVKVALDAPAGLVGGGDDACTRGRELLATLGVRDGRGDELRELAPVASS
jgi:hypothetical protein